MRKKIVYVGKMKQLRLNFSDYSAEQQERDIYGSLSKSNRPKDIYVMRVNGDWGAILPRQRYNFIFNADKGVELTEFITSVKADLQELGINVRFHCVQNFGIESKIAEHQHLILRGKNDDRGY